MKTNRSSLSSILTATHINYYHVCHRKLWLFANGIRMEHTSDTVAEGKLIGDTSYAGRSAKYTELEIDGVKIDYYDAKNRVVHEVKKSDRIDNAHIAQVKYYLYKLQQHGIDGVKGILEYPKLRKREDVVLTSGDAKDIQNWEHETDFVMNLLDIPDDADPT